MPTKPRFCPYCARPFTGPSLTQHLRQKHQAKMVLSRGDELWPTPEPARDEILKIPTPEQVAFAQRSIMDMFKSVGCRPELFTLYASGNGVQIVITSKGAVDRVPVELHEIPTLRGRLQFMADRAKKLADKS